jgi:hypothetical protein
MISRGWRTSSLARHKSILTPWYLAAGGIAKKVQEAAAVAVRGIDVLIAQVGTTDALRALQLGPEALRVESEPEWTGTLVQLQKD